MTDGKRQSPRDRVRAYMWRNLAGCVALAGFVAVNYAQAVDGPLEGQNTIGSEDIIGDEVKSDDIGNGRIFNLDIADEIIQSGKVKDGTITGADFGLNSLTGTNIDEATLFNDNSLDNADVTESNLFNDNSLTAGDLFVTSVRTEEIVNGAVTTDKVTDGAIGSSELAPNSVNTAEIDVSAVGVSELAPVVVERPAAFTISAGAVVVKTISCPAGYAPLNVAFAGSPGLHVIDISPSPSAGELASFSVTYNNFGGPARTGEMMAICLVS